MTHVFLHEAIRHWYGRLPVWIRRCRASEDESENDLAQTEQTCGRSPVLQDRAEEGRSAGAAAEGKASGQTYCVRVWTVRAERWMNDLPHPACSQENGLRDGQEQEEGGQRAEGTR